MDRQKNRCTAALSNEKWVAVGLFSGIFFFFIGQPFIPLLGIETDEALFASPLFEPLTAIYSWHIGAHLQIPLMLISYLGCLKTLLYAPVFKLFGSGIHTIREPALIAGAVSVWLFFLLLRRVFGNLTAAIGCCLLSMDSLYLLTTCYDWGPVALQHLLIIGGALALVRFYQTQSEISLAAGWFLWGLALWDKALALWVLSGLGVACLALLPREIWRVVTWRRTLLSAAALTIGALPLIFYNVHFRLATIRENTVIDTSQLGTKFRYLTRAANGGVLLGFWNEPDELTPAPHAAAGVLEAASAGISSLAGRPSSDGLVIAVAAAILLAPFGGWACVRAVSFFLILMAVAWLQMALNAHTGATVHHTILLWPWPIAVVAVSFGALATRMGRFGIPAVAGVVALLGISCLLVTNEYYTRMVRNGGSPAWSTAVLPLAAWLKQSGAPTVFCSDWGELDTLIVLNRNQPKVRDATGITGDPAAVQWALSDPQNLFVAHTKEAEQIANSWQGFVDAAAKYGRTPQLVATVPDGFGRRIFAVYRFR